MLVTFSGFTCLCEEGYILNRDTGECTTELCADTEDTFCMNHGVCNEPGQCDCHEEWIDPNCETCELCDCHEEWIDPNCETCELCDCHEEWIDPISEAYRLFYCRGD